MRAFRQLLSELSSEPWNGGAPKPALNTFIGVHYDPKLDPNHHTSPHAAHGMVFIDPSEHENGLIAGINGAINGNVPRNVPSKTDRYGNPMTPGRKHSRPVTLFHSPHENIRDFLEKVRSPEGISHLYDTAREHYQVDPMSEDRSGRPWIVTKYEPNTAHPATFPHPFGIIGEAVIRKDPTSASIYKQGPKNVAAEIVAAGPRGPSTIAKEIVARGPRTEDDQDDHLHNFDLDKEVKARMAVLDDQKRRGINGYDRYLPPEKYRMGALDDHKAHYREPVSSLYLRGKLEDMSDDEVHDHIARRIKRTHNPGAKKWDNIEDPMSQDMFRRGKDGKAEIKKSWAAEAIEHYRQVIKDYKEEDDEYD